MNAILMGCKDITLLDINPFVKYYYYLKMALILCVSMDEYLLFLRYKNYPTRPSRRSCMWLTDEECIDSWITLLEEKGTNYNVFEMNLDGNIFCSTEELLPRQESRIKEIEEQAKKYWNPTKEDLEKSIKREYLFEGIARVKKLYR